MMENNRHAELKQLSFYHDLSRIFCNVKHTRKKIHVQHIQLGALWFKEEVGRGISFGATIHPFGSNE